MEWGDAMPATTNIKKLNTSRARVEAEALKVIMATPSGVRWADLCRAVSLALPEENPNTIRGSLHHITSHLPKGVYKPGRGLYAYGNEGATPVADVVIPTHYKEQDFYQPFADWLINEVEEATDAVSLGGSGFGGKWGTPDVIGLYRPRKTDPIQFTEEVIAAEIKIDTSGLIVAFGQACAYKLFAHRVYIVVPRNAMQEDLRRLDALAGVVGIGLVKFNAEDPANPEFTVMARAAKHEPDYFYTNTTLSKCKDALGL
jgi:hypothetical protein